MGREEVQAQDGVNHIRDREVPPGPLEPEVQRDLPVAIRGNRRPICRSQWCGAGLAMILAGGGESAGRGPTIDEKLAAGGAVTHEEERDGMCVGIG